MSSSLSGGTNALNFNVVKSSSTLTSLTSSSPSSTLTISEASNVSQSAIRTKRPRTNRKRPNQTFNEAAALLSKAYPNLFPNLEKLPPPCKFTKPITEFNNNDSFEPLLLPFDLRARDYDATAFLLRENKSTSQTSVREKIFSGERSLSSGAVNLDEVERDSGEDFDCQSILEEEIDEGIDSIIGSRIEDAGNSGGNDGGRVDISYGGGFRSFGGKFSWKKALRHVDGVNLLNFAMIDVLEISPGMKKMPAETATIVPVTEKKRQRKKENLKRNASSFALPLRLKLNYADVRNSWSERGLPFRR